MKVRKTSKNAKTGRKLVKPSWARHFDWRLTDAEISRRAKVSRTAVGQFRKAHGFPESPIKGQRGGYTAEMGILSISVKQLKSMTVDDIAESVGCSHSHALHIIRKNGLPCKVVRRRSNRKIDWPDNDSPLWALSNIELAERLGTTPGYVSLWRNRQKIPGVREFQR